ncbi:MAG: hypothetical protein WB818_08130 [Desulfobacterales bacterium]
MKSTAAPNYAFHRKSFPLRSKVSGELKPMRQRVQPRNRMRENRTSGTVWGVLGNRHSYYNGRIKYA